MVRPLGEVTARWSTTESRTERRASETLGAEIAVRWLRCECSYRPRPRLAVHVVELGNVTNLGENYLDGARGEPEGESI